MTFRVTTRPVSYNARSQLVSVKYGDVTFDEELLNDVELESFAADLVDAALTLNPEALTEVKIETHSEAIRQCCDWLKGEGYAELADNLINHV